MKKSTLARFMLDILTTDKVEIAFAKALTIPKAVTFYDQVGQQLQKLNVHSATMNISITTRSSGTYRIPIDGQSREIVKFVKTR